MKRDYKSYAQALAEVALKDLSPTDSKHAMENFLALVKKNGDGSMLAKIIAHADSLYMKKGDRRSVIVESARPLSRSAHADIAKHLEKKDIVEEKINPELIAGVRITVNNEHELDMSFSSKVNQLFK